MAARTRKIRHDDETRARIQVGNIITRLEGHISGKFDMPASAVTAALGLLRKVLPDLNSVEQNVQHSVSDELAELLNAIDSKTRGIPLANGISPTATSH